MSLISDTDIEECISQVKRLAWYFSKSCPATLDFDNLMSTGNLALVVASKAYKGINGRPFWEYAIHHVAGMMRREISNERKYCRAMAQLDVNYYGITSCDIVTPKVKKKMTGASVKSLESTVLGEDGIDDTVRAKMARAAVNNLDVRKKTILKLYHDESIPLRTIAERFEINEGSVRRTRDRAMCEVRSNLLPPQRIAELCLAGHKHTI